MKAIPLGSLVLALLSSTAWAGGESLACTVKGVLRSGHVDVAAPIKTEELSITAVRSGNNLSKVTLRESLAQALTAKKRIRFSEPFNSMNPPPFYPSLQIPHVVYAGPQVGAAKMFLSLALDLTPFDELPTNGELAVIGEQGELRISLSCREDNPSSPILF